MSRVARRRGQGLDSEPLERSSVKYNMSIPAPKFIGTVNRPIRAPNHQRLPRTAQHKACSARPFIPRLSGSRIPRPGTEVKKAIVEQGDGSSPGYLCRRAKQETTPIPLTKPARIPKRRAEEPPHYLRGMPADAPWRRPTGTILWKPARAEHKTIWPRSSPKTQAEEGTSQRNDLDTITRSFPPGIWLPLLSMSRMKRYPGRKRSSRMHAHASSGELPRPVRDSSSILNLRSGVESKSAKWSIL